METQELLLTAVRGIGVYVFVLIVIRFLGKREIGNFTAFDLLVALMLGEVVDEIIYGDVSFAQGAVAIIVVALAQYTSGWLTYLNHTADRILDGTPTIVIKDGKLQRAGMRKERVNEQELMSLLRERGIKDIREVKLAAVEIGGELSVIKFDWAETIQKADLGGVAAEEKRKVTGGKDEPPPDKDTCSEKVMS
jgi:uncharacterized membrane protein YcaP (DUF421 family)